MCGPRWGEELGLFQIQERRGNTKDQRERAAPAATVNKGHLLQCLHPAYTHFERLGQLLLCPSSWRMELAPVIFDNAAVMSTRPILWQHCMPRSCQNTKSTSCFGALLRGLFFNARLCCTSSEKREGGAE